MAFPLLYAKDVTSREEAATVVVLEGLIPP